MGKDRTYIFDVETDGIEATKIHCVVVYCLELDWYAEYTDYKQMTSFFETRTKSTTLIAHNGIRYDIPVLERLLDIKIEARVIDTLALAWYLEPNRIKYGLEDYGVQFGIPKPVVTDWKTLPIEVYLDRCLEDVKINTELWYLLEDKLDKLYDGDYSRIVNYLTAKMDCAIEQEEVKVELNVEGAKRLLQELTIKRDKKVLELIPYMPKVPKYVTKNKPKDTYKKNGSFTKRWIGWVDVCIYEGVSEQSTSIKILTGHSEPNPNAPEQMKDWLYSLGWVPETFKYVKDKKEKSGKRKIAQIKKDKELCPSVVELIDDNPCLKSLEGLTILNHRIGVVNGFLNNRDENNMLMSEIGGFTNTLRYKHKVIANIPGCDKIYGKEIRQLLISGSDLFCGSDLCSLENTTRDHYIYPYDPEYVDSMTNPGFDSHLDLGIHSGYLTEQQVQAHKNGTEDHSDTRRILKRTNYACIYGIGAKTLARDLGISKTEADRLIKSYWERNWSVKSFTKSLQTKECLGSKWVLNPVSGFWYSLRYDKDKFSTVNQSTGVYCFDVWCKYVRSTGVKIAITMHDDLCIRLPKDKKDKLEGILNWAIEQTNLQLSLNKKLEIDTKWGTDYSKIH